MKRLSVLLLLVSCGHGADKITSDEKEAVRQMQINLLVAQRERSKAELDEMKAMTALNSTLANLFKNHKLDPKKWQLNERLAFEEVKEKK